MSPIVALFQNHFHKDLDDNFFQSLEALLFLSPPTLEDFTTTFSKNLSFDTSLPKNSKTASLAYYIEEKLSSSRSNEPKSLGQLLREQLDKDSHYSLDSRKSAHNTVEYNITDLLICKLVENLRRLYAAHKAQNKTFSHSNNYLHQFGLSSKKTSLPLNNQDTLLEQQNLIYKVLSLIDTAISFDSEKKWFEKAMLGNNTYSSPIQLWAYLGMHEQIQKHNRDSHYSILNRHINHPISRDFLENMSSLVHQPDQQNILHTIFKHSDINDLISCSFENNQAKHSWMLSVCEYLFNPDNAIKLSSQQIKLVLHKIIATHLLDSTFLSTFIHDKSNFITNIYNACDGEEYHGFFKNLINQIQVEQIGKNTTADFVLSHIKEFNEPFFLMTTIKNQEANIHQKNIIYAKYDLQDLSLLKNVATSIHKVSSESQRNKEMLSFMEIHDNAMSKEILAHILSIDSSYINICKPAYLRLKISEGLEVKPDNTSSRRIKI